MLNILVPLGGESIFFKSEEYIFPKPLIEIGGQCMIQRVVHNLSVIRGEKQFIFVVKREDCQKFHLDNSIRLLCPTAKIVYLEGATKGAACSCLMAINYIDSERPLLISNGDQVFSTDLNGVIDDFVVREAEAGVITFESIHPRWAYVQINEAGQVVEAVEKRPISKKAIAGFYYFRSGANFVWAAMESISKDVQVGQQFYIAPVLNELILQNRLVLHYPIPNNLYHTFYAPQKIREFEKLIDKEVTH